jgi:hypothetical protein
VPAWRRAGAFCANLNLSARHGDKLEKAGNPAAGQCVFRAAIRERRPMLSRISKFDPVALEIFVCGILVGTYLAFAF